MSEQDGTQSSIKQRRSRKTSTANQQNGKQAPVTHRPDNEDKEAWKAYWKTQGQPWRTEPEIDAERQAYLTERRSLKLDDKHDDYLFNHIKLDRADIEWLLATHENGRGPVYPKDESHRDRWGLNLSGADLRDGNLEKLPLGRAAFIQSDLKRANLSDAHLEKTHFFDAHLEGADLGSAHLEGANLIGTHLAGARLSNVYFDSATRLDGAIFANDRLGSARLADVHWNDANLAVVLWSAVSILGEESYIERLRGAGEEKYFFYQDAARAYRQLSVVLRNQGLSEDANRFAYRAQLMQRKAYWYDGRILQFLGSFFLELLAGYGYKPMRSFLAYLIVITTFAIAYFIIGRTVGPALSPLGSFVFSMTSFHGRGFFPGGIKLDDPLTVLAALEALVGLLIEVTFIATLTQRLFGK